MKIVDDDGNVMYKAETFRRLVEMAVSYEESLVGVDLRGADLRGANLSYTDLAGARLSGADLRATCLDGADLRGADLSCAKLLGAITAYATGLPGGDISD